MNQKTILIYSLQFFNLNKIFSETLDFYIDNSYTINNFNGIDQFAQINYPFFFD